jgi:hypothetical protein
MPAFPEPEWFAALGHQMAKDSEVFRRLGYAEVRFGVRVFANDRERIEATTGIELTGYEIGRTLALDDAHADFDPDFVICAPREVWDRMLNEIAHEGHPELRRTLSSLALVGEEMWLDSSDQLREDKFYRFNQTLQEFFNLSAKLPPG